MRRTLVATLVAAALALPLLPGPAATADPTTPDTTAGTAEPTDTQADEQADGQARAALATVAGLLEGPADRSRSARAAAAPADPTLAMRDLFVALPRLAGADREHAEALLARPTDGAGDRFGDGYDQPATATCGTNVCIHHVPTGADAPPSAAWVGFVKDQMNKVWKHEVTKMGYRRPLSDKAVGAPRNGGNGKFDVYLKDLGGRGLYGYCAPEYRPRGRSWVAISYCVLDNDFATAQFGTAPKPTLRATAAHEFFHAVQFAYDYGEDRWFMESTATWMEERYADNVDDNRQYLPASQVQAPGLPLDMFSTTGSTQYGNWVFWEYLSRNYGNGFVRDVWTTTAPRKGSNSYAIAAIKRLTQRRGGFSQVYRNFAAANLFPQRAYPEGKAWGTPGIAGKLRLSKKNKIEKVLVTLPHLSAMHVRVRPDKGLTSKRWRLQVKVDGPGRASSPSVVLSLKRRGGGVGRVVVPLGKKGGGKVLVPFSRKAVSSVTATVVNASTRFACYTRDQSADPMFSCQGTPRDDDKIVTIKFWATKVKAKKRR
jgi:hypothetical protein